MSWVKTALSELLGLFVDDGSFALAIVGWLLVAGLVLPRLGLSAGWAGLILFAGLAAILVESALRRARS
ncbi:MAG: hypothetical protein NVSMB18_30160 [Acetobacteraceae bacterium]